MLNLKVNKRIYIAGHTGMVGSAIYRKLISEGYTNIFTADYPGLDLIRQEQVEKFFNEVQPEYVIIAAAKVGGILANNTYRADFLYDNLMIQSNIIHASFKYGVKKLIFLGSSCIYPRDCPQPLKEEYLLSGYLENTNEPYAIAKIAGIKLCENYYRQYGCNFYSIMPTNLYGPNDNYDLETSHVLPALIRKFHEGKVQGKSKKEKVKRDDAILSEPDTKGIHSEESQSSNQTINQSSVSLPTVTLWGTGTPRREFLYVDDLADAIYFLMNNINAKDIYDQGITHLNIGTGEDLTISELAELIKKIVCFEGVIIYDPTKPDGTPQKLLDVTRIHQLGWKHKTGLEEGIRKAYEWFLQNKIE